MKQFLSITFSLVIMIITLQSARAEILTLQNDGWNSGDTAYVIPGFAPGDAAAVTLGPVDQISHLTKIHFIFGGSTTTQILTVVVYGDTGDATPGAQLYSADYELTGADNAIQEIDLVSENISIPAGTSIRVSLVFQHTGAPSVAGDDDGDHKGDRNWIFSYDTGTWAQADSLGVTRDWIIRAMVDTYCEPAVEFTCGDDSCILSTQVCDGTGDCPGGDDETDCSCDGATEFTCGDDSCISRALLCDGTSDCTDGSDEVDCSCDGATEFTCGDDSCISRALICDGTSDCTDGSDETACPCDGATEFTCGDDSCVVADLTCDGTSDCSDGSDEWPLNTACTDPGTDPGTDKEESQCGCNFSGGSDSALLPLLLMGMLGVLFTRRRLTRHPGDNH
ncbi:LDL receptor domain-containing protein [Myxococcota bacterium]|nr:LDL receptor domain-containing protein [Myxococcota bacterium]MBU1537723.1 LDL receptor domain-containing protein [Myxococcota bacterium]